MPERSPLPYPEIARFTNEGGLVDEPSLEGAPSSPEDSVFLSLPEVAKMSGLALNLAKANTAERRHLMDSLALQVLENPRRLTEILDATALLQEVKAYRASDVEVELHQALERVHFKKFPPAAKVLEQWLTIYAESALYQPIAEKVLKRLIERCADTKSTSSVLYELALGGMTSANKQVARKTVEIFAFTTPILPVGSQRAEDHMMSNFDIDDTVVRKTMEIDLALDLLASPELIAQKNRGIDAIIYSESGMKRAVAFAKNHKERFDQLTKFYSSRRDGMSIPLGGEEKFEIFPYSLAVQAGPLRKWSNDYFVQEERGRGRNTHGLHFPDADFSIELGPQDRASTSVQEHLRKSPRANAATEDARHWQTLAYLRLPEFDGAKENAELAQINEQVVQEMRDNTGHLLSPRGDLVEVIDPMVRDLGFESILYEMDKINKRDTVITLNVEGHQYRIMLDEYFVWREAKSHEGIRMPTEAAFLEHILLSHLKEIRCSDRVMETAGETTKTTAAERGKKFRGRRAHRRTLSEGQSPTPEQIMRILSVYGIDLVRVNREAAAKGEGKKITFVYEAEAKEGSAPIRSQAPAATKGLQALLRK